jgi:uncharacterized membrane protein YgcG
MAVAAKPDAHWKGLVMCPVNPPVRDTGRPTPRSAWFHLRLPRLAAVGVALTCLAASSFAAGQSNTTGDNWSVGGNADASTAATVSVPAPAPTPTPGDPKSTTTIRHSTAAVPAPTPPSSQNATPGVPTPTPADAAEYEDTDPSALTAFSPQLDPYGRWVDDSRYGRVWVPDAQVVGPDFAPYVSNGHWALDVENNWVWESDYPFGWVVFHYGRWVWIDSVGWSWVPGRRYAPAWVVWRVPTADYAYVGWAPAPPTFVWYGTGLFWLTFYPPLPFVFCPSHYVFYSNFGPYLVHDHRFAATLVHHSVWYSTAPVYGRGYVSPPLDRARVPAHGVPSQRVSANPRAAALARPAAASGYSNARVGAGTSRPAWDGHPARTGVPRESARPGAAPQGFSGFGGTRPAGYAPRSVQSLGTTPGEGGGHRPTRSWSQPGGGGYVPRSSAPGYSVPSRTWSSRPSSGNSYSAPSRAPSFSAPSRSYSAPSYSAPSRSYSAPSYSAPSRSFSSPRSPGGGFSSGGGFRSGGGGSFRGGGGRHR